MISSGLLLKGGLGFVVLGGAGGLYLCYSNGYLFWSNSFEKTLYDAGLSCSFPDKPDNGVDCSIKPGAKIKFEVNSTEYEVSSESMGKNTNLRFYFVKDEKNLGVMKGNEMKNKLFRSLFTLEGGDLTLNGDVKAKEFEGFKSMFGSNKNGVISSVTLKKLHESNALIKELTGFPCDLPENSGDSTDSECTLNSENIDQIKFEGKGDKAKATLSGNNPSISVDISKLATSDPDFPLDYKFTFTSTQETTINLGEKTISLGANIGKDFRIKKTPVTGTKRQALTLEEAWTVKTLGAKVGLECPETVTNGTGECSLTNTKINVKNDNDKKFTGLSKKNGGEEKKVKFEEKAEGHNQGFKFYTEETNGIALQNSEGESDSDDKKIAHKGDESNPVSYQILKDGDEWYLTKKNNSGA